MQGGCLARFGWSSACRWGSDDANHVGDTSSLDFPRRASHIAYGTLRVSAIVAALTAVPCLLPLTSLRSEPRFCCWSLSSLRLL